MKINGLILKGSSRKYDVNIFLKEKIMNKKRSSKNLVLEKMLECIKYAGENGIEKSKLRDKFNYKYNANLIADLGYFNCVYESLHRVFYFSKDLKEKYILFNDNESMKFFSKAHIAEYLNCESEFIEKLIKNGNCFNGYFIDEIIN